MRSVRVLDVLFTAQSAVNLLSRVIAAQTGNLCRVEPKANTHAQDVNVEASGSMPSPLKGNAVFETVEPAMLPFRAMPKPAEPVTHPLETHPQEETKSITNATSVSKAASLPHAVVRQRYTKPSSKLFESLESNSLQQTAPTQMIMKASKVPSSRMGRLFHYGGLAAGMGMGAASEFMRRAVNPSGTQGSVLMSEANVTRLVDKLSRMRGAALKLGQFMSIQDSHVLPPQVEQIFRRVQNSAHYMPGWQMERVMASELGPDWKSKFLEFNSVPIAAASIGQVHAATLASDGISVAVKVQFPAVAESITSDLNNLSMLLAASSLLPKGLFLDSTLKATKAELVDECDYRREAECARRFRRELDGDERFQIMRIVDELSTSKVLVMERMTGVPIVQAENWPQELRNEIATSIMSLCLRELFHFRFMQTDPNWTNFLYDTKTGKIQLIDFGASREYSKEFMDDWLRLLQSGVSGDKERCALYSRKLGYLTGEESKEMVDAHVRSIVLLATPFRKSTRQPYNFEDQSVTDEIRALIPFMLQNRLTPPPRETYSLNRKLSGAFLLGARLKARVDCAEIWEDVTGGYQFTTTAE